MLDCDARVRRFVKAKSDVIGASVLTPQGSCRCHTLDRERPSIRTHL